MPTNRTRRKHHLRTAPGIPPGVWAWLIDLPFDREKHTEGRLLLFTEDRAALWTNHRTAVLAYWVVVRPFTRPRAWWQYDPDAAEPRRPRETQRAYLIRHRWLLTPSEIERLR